jgi:hypothetical protein
MTSPPSPSRRLRGCLISTLAYLATTAISVWLLKNALGDAPTPVRAGVSLLPLIAIGFAIREVLLLVRSGDELQRRIDLEALAASAVTVGLGCLSLSLLVGADVFTVQGKTVLIWILPALSVVYVLARILAQARYR